MKKSKSNKLEVKIDSTKSYTPEESINILKQGSKAKFDETVELHIRLGIDPKKGDQQIRGTMILPHGSGKIAKVAVFAEEAAAKDAKAAGADLVGGEELIAEIKKTGKIEFDVAVATPDMMKHLAKIAKVLGPRGLMPSPKNETVTHDVKKIVSELKKGKVAFKNDSTGNIHMLVGKNDFDAKQLQENIEAALDAIQKAKPASSKGTYIKSISINATMAPSIKVAAL